MKADPGPRCGRRARRSTPTTAPARTSPARLRLVRAQAAGRPVEPEERASDVRREARLDAAHRRGIEHGWRLAMSHAALRLLHLSEGAAAPDEMLAAARTLLGVRDDPSCLDRDTRLALEAIHTGEEPRPIRLSDAFRDDLDALAAGAFDPVDE